MKKILFISNVSAGVTSFSYDSLLAARTLGLEFHMAANYSQSTPEKLRGDEAKYGVSIHQLDLSRSPFSFPTNMRALRRLTELIRAEKIDYIHCNTPVGGMLGRIAGKKCGVKSVIYEAHGFHFYKGAPKVNWLLYYPIEKLLAGMTDAIITINREDFAFAQKHLKPKNGVYYVPGVGIELEQWQGARDDGKRAALGFDRDDFIALVVGRLEKNKNCQSILEAVGKVGDRRVKLAFCGDGEDRRVLEDQARGLKERVRFLGNRSDMREIYHMADCFVMASYREGLSRSIMEAMACGLPCVVSDIRGNRDLIDAEGGFLVDPHRPEEIADGIQRLCASEALRARMGAHNLEKIEQFTLERVVDALGGIYREQFGLSQEAVKA